MLFRMTIPTTHQLAQYNRNYSERIQSTFRFPIMWRGPAPYTAAGLSNKLSNSLLGLLKGVPSPHAQLYTDNVLNANACSPSCVCDALKFCGER